MDPSDVSDDIADVEFVCTDMCGGRAGLLGIGAAEVAELLAFIGEVGAVLKVKGDVGDKGSTVDICSMQSMINISVASVWREASGLWE